MAGEGHGMRRAADVTPGTEHAGPRVRADRRPRLADVAPTGGRTGSSSPVATGMRRSKWFASLPNLITVGRLFLVPVVIGLLLDRHWMEAFTAFVIAGVSDAVDGFIARHYNLRSDLGSYLDPLADKALLVSIFVALSVTGVIPNWLTILVVSRDLMIVGAVLIAVVLGRPMAIRPLFISKATTTVQIAFAAALIGTRAFGVDLDGALHLALWVVSALTVASGVAYLARWLDHMSG